MKITIDHLRAAGLTDTQILDVIQAATKKSTEARREQWKTAAQNYRERQASSISSPSSKSSASSPSSRHDDEIALSLSSSNIISKEERKKERVRGSVCPTTFSPSEDHYAAGLRLGLGREVVDTCAAQMRDWSAANSNRPVARKSDWSRAFFSWLGRHSKETPRKIDPANSAKTGEIVNGWQWTGSRWKQLEA